MLPYYPARDGYPSMLEADDDAGSAIGATDLHQPLVHRRASPRPIASVFVLLFRILTAGAAKQKPG